MSVIHQPNVRPAGAVRRWLQRQPISLLIALAILIPILAAVLFAPLLTGYSPLDQDLLARNQGPSAEHLLGTSGRLIGCIREWNQPDLASSCFHCRCQRRKNSAAMARCPATIPNK